MERLYRGGGWLFVTRPAVVLISVLALGGIPASVIAARNRRILDVGKAGLAGGVRVVIAFIVAITLHELAHALTAKSPPS